MVGTVQTDRCGAGPLGKAACKTKVIEIHTHESLIYQHNTKPLCYAVWGDNNFVKTLSNFHSPVIMTGGMKRKKKNLITKRRERESSAMSTVLCNKSPTVIHTTRSTREMELKLSMIYQLNRICMDGDPS
jgi:hypothetical protein